MEASTPTDLSVESIITKVKAASVIDGEGVDGIGGATAAQSADGFSMQSFYKALEKEVKESASYFGEKVKGGGAVLSVASTIKEVKAKDGKFTWVLLGVL